MRILYNSVGCRLLFPSLRRTAAPASTFSSSFQLSRLMSSTPETQDKRDHHLGLRGSRCCHTNADDHVDFGGHGDRMRRKESMVVILGATGTGKSKLSIDLATRFAGEVVNMDKIQVYRGLDVTTNKIPVADRCGVPHHLLGELDPVAAGDLPPAEFRALAAHAIAGIVARRRLPVLAGGSNSFVHAALAGRYDQELDLFAADEGCSGRRREWPEEEDEKTLRYRCCFLWVDVEAAALAEHLDRRVDDMVGEGMVEELGRYFAEEGPAPERRHPGIAKAIGVPEFRDYFVGQRRGMAAEHRAAVAAIKVNTRRLAEKQVRKIRRLGMEGLRWRLRKVDATAVVRAKLAGGDGAEEAWKRDVVGPSVAAVERFLEEEEEERVVRQVEEVAEKEEAEEGHHHRRLERRQQHDRHRRRIIVPAVLKVSG